MHLPFVLLVLIDQITKAVFANRDFLVKNYALPFGFDFGALPNFFLLLVIYVAVGWMIMRTPSRSKLIYWGKSIFLAGATSNLVDRVFYGYVRDFIDLGLGFVFNLADIFIVLGLAVLLLSSPKNESVEKVLPTSKT